LLETDYNYDLSNNIEIVTLSNGSDFYYIPSNRILSVPVIDGVIYRNKVISIPLGNIPDDLNLKTLLDNLNDSTVSNLFTIFALPSLSNTLAFLGLQGIKG
jgi:hypothetical protein